MSVLSVAALALALAACGDDDENGDAGADGDTVGKVGVILPDTKTSVRWEQYDRPSLKAAFDAAGIESDIQNAEDNVPKFQTICESMINSGVEVLLIVNLDSESGAACQRKAADAGVLNIDYDRLTLGGNAEYYVSFNNVDVGKLQGEGLISCLDTLGKSQANVAFINGAATDNNASLFKQGYQEALQPKFDSGDYTLVGDQSGEWDPDTAATVFDGIYTAQNGKLDGLIVANDGMADGVSARLAANGLSGQIPITGQDATVTGLQRVLKGEQCVTVYKNTNLEAELASQIAIALINGDTDAADAIATDSVEDSTGGRTVKSAFATPVGVKDGAGVKKVIDDGQVEMSLVCTGEFAALCTAAGIS